MTTRLLGPSRLPVDYPQTILTLSARPCNHPDSVGSPSVGRRARLAAVLHLARKRHDLLAIANLETILARMGSGAHV